LIGIIKKIMKTHRSKEKHETSDFDSYIMLDTCEDGTVVTTTPVATSQLTGKDLRRKKQSSDNPFVLPMAAGTVELEHKLLKEITFLRSQNQSYDVYLRCDDGDIFAAHKNVLSAISPYFEAMFQANMVERTQAIINIQGVPSVALKSLIDFAYSAKLAVTLNNIYDVLIAANMLRIEVAEEQCLEFMRQNIDVENCIEILSIAEMLNCEKLYQCVCMFITSNFRKILRDPNFFYLSPQQLESLICDDHIDISCESEVFDAVMLWIQFDLINRKLYLSRLLRHVRLMQLSRKYLVDRVLRESLIMSEESARNIVFDALDRHILPERTCLVNTNIMSHLPRQITNRTIYVVGGKGTLKIIFRIN